MISPIMSAETLRAKTILQKPEYKKGEIIISEPEILNRTDEIAGILAERYQGQNLLMVGLLNGAFIATSYLGQALWRARLDDTEVDFMAVSSYGNNTISSGALDIHKGLKIDPSGRNILLIDDVFDSGLTLVEIHEKLRQEAASVASFVLVSKRNPKRTIYYKPDYIAFETPNIWLEGGGMDSAEKGRLNPNIVVGMDYSNLPAE